MKCINSLSVFAPGDVSPLASELRLSLERAIKTLRNDSNFFDVLYNSYADHQ